MKCLTLIQPYATLVVAGAKHYETRGWKPDFRGLVAVHAAVRFPDEERALCLREPFRSALLRAGYRYPADLPTQAILGTVELQDVVPAAQVLPRLRGRPEELAFADFENGRWAWCLARAHRFDEPRPCRGRQGLFEHDVQLSLFE